MSKRLSLPKNKEKFNLYVNFVSSFYRSGIIAQLISGVTAFIVYYAICQNRFTPIVGAAIALLFVLLIELGQRSAFPAITDYFLAKRKNKIEHAIGIFAIASGVLFVALSTYGSLKIVPVAVEEKVALADEKTTHEADQNYQEKKLTIVADYDRERAINQDLLKSRVESNNLLYQSKIDKQKALQKSWRYRGERENQNYSSKIKSYNIVIDKLKSERDSIQSALVTASDAKLAQLTQEHKTKLSDIDVRLLTQIEKVDTYNEEQVLKTTEKKYSFTGVGILLILICQFWCVASIVARKLFLRLSEIESVFYADQYYFEENIFEKFNQAISKALNYYLGTAIDAMTSRIPDNTQIKKPAVLLDYGDGAQEIKKVEFEASEQATIVVAANNPAKYKETVAPVSKTSDKIEGDNYVAQAPKTAHITPQLRSDLKSDEISDEIKKSAEVKYIDLKNEIDRVKKRWIRALKKGDTLKATQIEETEIKTILDKGFVATYDRRAFKISIKQKK